MGLPQTLYSGLAFGKDGTHLYAVFDSLSAPVGNNKGATGNAVAVYEFNHGQIEPQQLLPVPLQQLALGKLQNQVSVPLPAGTAIPSPAGIAVRKGPDGIDELLVAADRRAFTSPGRWSVIPLLLVCARTALCVLVGSVRSIAPFEL